VLGRALVGQRQIGREDRGWVALFAVLLLSYAVLGAVFPRIIAWPIALLFAWLGIAAVVRVASRKRPGDRG
jgi:cardiolipin synthase